MTSPELFAYLETMKFLKAKINPDYIARLYLRARNSMPVEKVKGSQPPKYVGRHHYWTTPSGKTEVRHPNAYGWPTLYHHSTLRIQVGRGWLARNKGAKVLTSDGSTCILLKKGPVYKRFGFKVYRMASKCHYLVTKGKWDFHTSAILYSKDSYSLIIKEAIAALKKQRKADRQLAQLKEKSSTAWVTRDNSLRQAIVSLAQTISPNILRGY